jgi:tetratricopeptide (TPR) repeat protein
MRHLLVIARNTTFTYKGDAVDVPSVAAALGVRYVLEGSVRKAGNRVRITAQLIDGKSGNQIWAERYDRELEDIFAVQDEITETVVRAIEPELSRAERERSRRIPPENLDAWAALQRGISCYYELQRDSYAEAINLFDKATQLDPTFALAFAWAATVRCRAAIIGFAKFDRESAYALAQRGINLDPQESMAHYSLGTCHYIARQPEFALGEFEEALRINPNNEQAMHQMARALTLLGRHAKAIDCLDTALKVSPRDPLTGVFLAAKSLAYLLLRDQQNAIECAKTAVRYPQPIYAPAFLLSALGHAGRTDETPAALLELRRVRPQFSISYLRENMTFPLNDADMSYFLEGLAKGGLD